MRDNKGVVITIAVLILIIIGLGGFIFYDKFYLPNKEDNTLTTIGENEIDLNSFSDIYDTLDKMDKAFNNTNSTFCGYPYSQKKLEMESFKPDAALFMALYSEMNHTGGLHYVAEGKLKNNFERIFGKSIEFNPALPIEAGDNYKFAYDESKKLYAYIALPSVLYAPRYEVYNVKTVLEDGNVIVTRKVFYVEYVSVDGGATYSKAELYNNQAKQNKIGELKLNDGFLSNKEVIAKFGSSCLTFNYYFTQRDDMTYLLSKIELKK